MAQENKYEYTKDIKRERALLKKYNLRLCSKCGEIKEIINFSGYYCRNCMNIYRKDRYKPKWMK